MHFAKIRRCMGDYGCDPPTILSLRRLVWQVWKPALLQQQRQDRDVPRLGCAANHAPTSLRVRVVDRVLAVQAGQPLYRLRSQDPMAFSVKRRQRLMAWKHNGRWSTRYSRRVSAASIAACSSIAAAASISLHSQPKAPDETAARSRSQSDFNPKALRK